MSDNTYHLGIDPGVRNLAVALLDNNGKFVNGKVFDAMPENVSIVQAIDSLYSLLSEVCEERVIRSLGIERFVSYKGLQTSSSENILMLTGGLVSVCRTKLNLVTTPEVRMYRAIDWKPKLCKALVKFYKFSNPSSSFDKKYSKAAAECITGVTFKNDHLADAVCLAYISSKQVSQEKQ